MSEVTGISNSGTLTEYLKELEQCGFVRRYQVAGKKVRDSIYQLFVLFVPDPSESTGEGAADRAETEMVLCRCVVCP